MLHQRLLRAFMTDSPYRGLLIYHDLGSGKTCTAILASESMTMQKDIVVILPASLKNNFIEKGLMFCGNKKYHKIPSLIDKKYTFISANSANTLEQLQKIGSLDNKLLIVDEIHNLLTNIINPNSKNGGKIYDMIMKAKNLKIIFT